MKQKQSLPSPLLPWHSRSSLSLKLGVGVEGRFGDEEVMRMVSHSLYEVLLEKQR
jgi:hypothetical protein